MKLDLHQSGAVPDWENIPESERNVFQRIAARTNGWLTPGNVISAAGGGLVVLGLRDFQRGKRLRGTLEFGAGRVLDLLDGVVADKTGTKSPLGGKVDAVIDQAGLALAIPAMKKAGVISNAQTVGLAAEWLVSTGASAYATTQGVELKTGWAGKRSTFAKWVGIGLGALAEVADELDAEQTASVTESVGHIALNSGIALGARASAEYARDAGLLTIAAVSTRTALGQ